MKIKLALVVLVILLALIGWIWYQTSGVSNRELKSAIESESADIRRHIDERCDKLEIKLDRIESKLDRLIELATPRLPDGMHPAS